MTGDKPEPVTNQLTDAPLDLNEQLNFKKNAESWERSSDILDIDHQNR